ncbi:MAG: DEAD/DEAH box helicase [Myxococcales bacterium]|nr:DEAD/DEAH box helicase [Myxococcales bacterium]
MTVAARQFVEHVSDFALGHGKVQSVDTVAGITRAIVKWSNRLGPQEHTVDELRVLVPLHERLAEAGPATRVPFQLKVFGRWFEARHALTGELSNQPFQMLPHQVIVVNRVVNSRPDDRAWLIADDVGLGKTIEAGMILEVLRKKTLGRFRCLILTPAGLMPQWQDELRRRFHREFRVFESRIPNDLEAVDQLLASIDTLKLQKFKPALQVATPWDLVIVDEAHHLATTPNVQTHQLAQFLRSEKKARNLLFLTATPHSGNNEHFFNMLRILREDLFPKGATDYPNVSLKEVMIRNRKSDVTDTKREKIFKGIAPARIVRFEPHADEVGFYEDLREYLRTGYKVVDRLQAQKDGQKASAVGFLMSTFGKLASSSRAAIHAALTNRYAALQDEAAPEGEGEGGDQRFPGEYAAAQVASKALAAPAKGKGRKKESLIEGELAQVKRLLTRLETLKMPDGKLTSFIREVKRMDPQVKLLIFTEYRATQAVLVAELDREFKVGSVVTIHGGMDMQERRKQVDAFNEQRPNPRFMVSTEAGGEGLNMQKSCHTVVNYDLPWNPMVLQQRIGRVYRYGQQHPVVVLNLKVDSDSEAFADQRVYDYLERKIDEITQKLQQVQDGDPEDLRGEVLGQVATQIPLDELYKTAVEEGRQRAERAVDTKANHIEQILANPEGMLGMFRGLHRFDITDYERVAARVSSSHLEFFVRQYLGHQGCTLKTSSAGLLSFPVPQKLIDVSNQLARTDPYQVHTSLTAGTVERATVDKETAQQTLGCRLLRFGDPAFESMVRHVQHGGFSQGVASIELPADALGWKAGERGSWALFDLRVVRQEGSLGGARVLRNELFSVVCRAGEAPVERTDVVESLHAALDGGLEIDGAETRRAYEEARKAADQRLAEMYQAVVAEYGTKEAILPQEVQDVAMAWVAAT